MTGVDYTRSSWSAATVPNHSYKSEKMMKRMTQTPRKVLQIIVNLLVMLALAWLVMPTLLIKPSRAQVIPVTGQSFNS